MSEREDVIKMFKACGLELDEEEGCQAYFKAVLDDTFEVIVYDINSLSESMYYLLNAEYNRGHKDGYAHAKSEIKTALGL